jgi:hypothetical protein
MQILLEEKYIINTEFIMYVDEIVDDETFIKEKIEQGKDVLPNYYSKITMKNNREFILKQPIIEIWNIINGKV